MGQPLLPLTAAAAALLATLAMLATPVDAQPFQVAGKWTPDLSEPDQQAANGGQGVIFDFSKVQVHKALLQQRCIPRCTRADWQLVCSGLVPCCQTGQQIQSCLREAA